jgi:hypothetical protein
VAFDHNGFPRTSGIPHHCGGWRSRTSEKFPPTGFWFRKIAVGVRFELTVAFDHSSFQDCLFQPLRHPTAILRNKTIDMTPAITREPSKRHSANPPQYCGTRPSLFPPSRDFLLVAPPSRDFLLVATLGHPTVSCRLAPAMDTINHANGQKSRLFFHKKQFKRLSQEGPQRAQQGRKAKVAPADGFEMEHSHQRRV